MYVFDLGCSGWCVRVLSRAFLLCTTLYPEPNTLTSETIAFGEESTAVNDAMQRGAVASRESSFETMSSRPDGSRLRGTSGQILNLR